MFCDLNVHYSPNEEKNYELMHSLHSLGYTSCAFNRQVQGSTKLTAAHGPFEFDPSRCPPLEVYSRLTIVISEVSELSQISRDHPIVNQYDLVALKTSDMKVLQQCLQLEVCDILNLNLLDRSNFQVKRTQVHVAFEKGIMFEISYDGLLKDSNSRRVWMGSAFSLLNNTKSNNIIFTSGATDALDFRSPHDVMNLSCIFSMTKQKAREALTKNPSAVIKRGLSRKDAVKATIRLRGTPNVSPKLKV